MKRCRRAASSCCWQPTSASLQDNLELACKLPVHGLHIDAINARDEIASGRSHICPDLSVLSLGVINGRNIWKTDLTAVLDWLEPLA